MQASPSTPEEYIAGLSEDRQVVMNELRNVITANLPHGFSEIISYGMISYVVPHTLYSAGYHCDPKQPLPFLSIASQKNYVAFYHMGLYADKDLLNWFKEEYAKQSSLKLDMGKSCIRFKKWNQIPLQLLGDLVSKITPQQWIKIYESQIKR